MGAAVREIPGHGGAGQLNPHTEAGPAAHLKPEMVTSQSRLDQVVHAISAEPAIALDLEGDSMHRYPPSICLVQIAVPGAIYLIDTTRELDMSGLGEQLADPNVEKIFHSAGHDLRCLDRDWGIHVANLYDTSIAAAFIGRSSLGLATVLSETLDVDLPKSKRLQKSDWSLRPLSHAALSYAASDVAHLMDLRRALGARLYELGRVEWVAEECARLVQVRHVPQDPETAFLSIKGSHALNPRGLAILRELSELREQKALVRGRPPFWMMSNEAMLKLAADSKVNPASVKGLGFFARGSGARELRKALSRGRSAEPYERPRLKVRPRRNGEASRLDEKVFRRRLDAMRTWRKAKGSERSLDASLIWPMASLERIARAPHDAASELESSEVRRWQVEQFEREILKEAAKLRRE